MYRRVKENTETPTQFFCRHFTLTMVLLALALVTVAFILILNTRLDDQSARETVAIETAALEAVVVNLHLSEIIEHTILADKNTSLALEIAYNISKLAIAANTAEIIDIDVQSDLFANMTALVQTLAEGYALQIQLLEEGLAQLLSEGQTNSTVVKSGTCTLQGITASPIAYDYKKLTISGLDYYYYVFGATPYDMTFDSVGFAIQGCTNGGLYTGPTGAFSPIFAQQRVKFTGGSDEITHVRAGSNKLEFKTTNFLGTKDLGIQTPLSHFVEFF